MIQKSNSTVIVNLSRLKKNAESLCQRLDKNTRIMAVVKADAYGHGAVEVARALDSVVGAYAVNVIEEGVELREHGIDKPILVFEVPDESFASQYRVHNLTASISSEEHFGLLPNGTSYHINFDTGMGRLGFDPEEAPRISELVEENRELFCTGIYSHFATADNPGSEKVADQEQQFKAIREHFPEEMMAHISNTGGASFYKTEPYNMVRLGIGLYGYPPGETKIEKIAPVLSWESRLAQVKRIATGSTVSYGATWKAPQDGYLGVIPVGYEDGLRRNLSGKASVHLNGKKYPLVGVITMNYSMVFLGNDKPEVGTEVKLLYSENTARHWAQKLGTIPYEVLTSITPKAPRQYEL